jgi:hypothetical protein
MECVRRGKGIHKIHNPVDKAFHRVVDSLGRLVGFGLPGGGEWVVGATG